MLSSSSTSFLPSTHFFLSSSSSLFYPPSYIRVLQAGSPRPAQTPPQERGGGHHARDRAGFRRLLPQRPAWALPRPGPHAPISEEPLGGVGGRSAKRRLGRGSKGRSFAAVTEADGGGGRAKVLLLWSGERVVLWPWISGELRSESGAAQGQRRSRFRCRPGVRGIVPGKRRSEGLGSESGCYQGKVGFHPLLGGRRRPFQSSTSPPNRVIIKTKHIEIDDGGN